MPYARAHALLLANGYKPFRALVRGSQAYHDHLFSRADVHDHYPEVVSCTRAGRGGCSFILARSPLDVLVVHTTGQSALSLVVEEARRMTATEAEVFYR